MTKERLAELRVLCDTTGLIPANIVREFIAHYDGFIGPIERVAEVFRDASKEMAEMSNVFEGKILK